MTRDEAFGSILKAVQLEYTGDNIRREINCAPGNEAIDVNGLYVNVKDAVTTLVDAPLDYYPLFIARAASSTKLNDVIVAGAMRLLLNGGLV